MGIFKAAWRIFFRGEHSQREGVPPAASATEPSSSGSAVNTPPSVPPRRAGSNVTCSVCACHGGETVIPVAKVTNRCSKIRTICCSCMERHIGALVEKQMYNIPCLCRGTQSACGVRLTFHEVREHATAQIFVRYDEGKLRAALELDPEFCWCARPGCGSGQMHSSMNRYPVMRCHVCRFKTCFRHHCKYHTGRTCEEYERDASRSDEVALLQLLNDSKYRRCPKCSQAVEKNGGCDHMTCRCKHEFCWRCLAPYAGETGIRTVGRRAHKTSCGHYRNK